MTEFVITVDENDVAIGTAEKMEAHEKALLHRAFSVFVFNSKGEMLLHQRALEKYHSGGKWTNTCCGHPRPEEATKAAAERRLMEEMGMRAELNYLFHFTYKAPLDNSLTEYEIDHVFVGISDAVPVMNPNEVMNYNYVQPELVLAQLKNDPDNYTAWFKLCCEKVIMEYRKIG